MNWWNKGSEEIADFKLVTDVLLLTAIGQIMLYVDGMNGVINHSDTIQWLYSLTASRVSIPAEHCTFLFLPL